MFEETFVLLDEIIADDKRKTTKKPTPINKKPPIKSKKKRKKKKPIVNDVTTKPKRKKTLQAANDDSPTAKIEHSLGSLQGKMSMKMDTSPDAMKFYKQSLSEFIKAPPTGSDGALVHSEDDKKREDAAVSALNDGMKALDHKPEDIANDLKDLAQAKKENPEKPIADIINDHKNKKSMSKTSLIIGGSVLAAGLFVGFAAISPGVAILAGMQVLNHVMSPEISGRILDHVLSKKDKDETGDEPEDKSNSSNEDTAPRQSRHNTQQEDEAEERENGSHRQADSILGDGIENSTKEILNTTRSDPKTAENLVNLTEDQLKKEQNKPDMSFVEGKKAEVKDTWAKRAYEFSKKSRDTSLSEEERNQHKRAARIAAGISGAPDLQKSMIETYHSNNAKPVAQKEPEHGDDDEEDGDSEEQPPFPDKKEEKTYQKSIDTVMDHESDDDKIHPNDIKKAHGLSDEQANKFLDRMEKEGFVGKADKDGRREIYGDEEEDEEPDDEPEPPSKGKKIQSSEQSDIDACIELTAALDWEITAASFKVFKNPSFNTFWQLFKNSKSEELRGIITKEGDIYWTISKDNVQHADIMSQEKLMLNSGKLYFIIGKHLDEDDDEYILMLTNTGFEKQVATNKSLYTCIEKSDVFVSYGKAPDFEKCTFKQFISKFNKEESNSWLELAALLNLRQKTDGVRGNGQDDLDNLGPSHVGPFELSPYFNEEPKYQPNDNGRTIDYAQNPNKPVNTLDYILEHYNIESLMDMGNDFTKTIKAPTYAALKLNPVSSRLLKDWCEKRGIKGVYPKHEFHITVCYSKDPIDYKPMVFTDGPKQVYPLKFDLLGREEDKKFIVLKLQKGFPHKRFEYAKSIGASHDFSEYLPHISISPPGHGMSQDDVNDLNKHIQELKVPLLIDYEFMDELNPDK